MKGRTTDVAKLVEDLPSTAALVMVSDIHLFACAVVWTGIFSYKSFSYVGKEWRGDNISGENTNYFGWHSNPGL